MFHELIVVQINIGVISLFYKYDQLVYIYTSFSYNLQNEF